MDNSTPDLTGKHILFFDGECAFCDRAVQFYTARDKADRLRITPLQSEFAAAELGRHGVDTQVLAAGQQDARALQDYYVLADYGTTSERLLRRSRATSLLLLGVGGGWTLLGSLLAILPAPLFDAGYRVISRNRYKWFGREKCLQAADRGPARAADWLVLGDSQGFLQTRNSGGML